MGNAHIGYCAVVSPKIDFWQGVFISDTPDLREHAGTMKLMAILNAPSVNPFGSLQAALAEAVITGKETASGAAALALSGTSRYFVVYADKQSRGMATRLEALNAKTIDEAKHEIDNLPEVLEIKKRLTDKLSMRDGRGRKKAFH